jgi:hypothetical protein
MSVVRVAKSILVVLFATTLWSRRAGAQAAPEGLAESDPSARTHDGFYLRLSLGGGALHAKFRGGETAPDSKGGGGAVMLDVLIGGTPATGLVVGGGYQFDMAQHADYEFGSNYTGSGGNVIRGVIGPFVEWFPDRHGGFSTGLLAGYTVLALQTPTIRILGTELGGNLNTLGIGGNLWVGYAHWISKQWSLGLVARGGIASTKNTEDSTQTGSATSWGVLITGVYH